MKEIFCLWQIRHMKYNAYSIPIADNNAAICTNSLRKLIKYIIKKSQIGLISNVKSFNYHLHCFLLCLYERIFTMHSYKGHLAWMLSSGRTDHPTAAVCWTHDDSRGPGSFQYQIHIDASCCDIVLSISARYPLDTPDTPEPLGAPLCPGPVTWTGTNLMEWLNV